MGRDETTGRSPGDPGRRRRSTALGVGLGVALAAATLATGGLAIRAMQGGTEQICTLGLAIADVDGESVVLQDQGEPGRDGCDRSERPGRNQMGPGGGARGQGRVLGFDCRVRDADGTVLATTEPNRPDGTCGQ